MEPVPTRLLSIDVDDLVVGVQDFLLGDDGPSGYTGRIDRDVAAVLDLLDRHGAKATFFVNAQYCDRHPSMASDIAARGHVLASHGFRHRDVRRRTLAQFRDDARRSLEVLGRYQEPILGYRPPGFSMPYDEAHLGVLRDLGFRYVSAGPSIPACRVPDGQGPVPLPGGLLHVPITSIGIAHPRLRLPIGYGTVARLLPEAVYLGLLRSFLRRCAWFHFYLHPFEAVGLDSAAREHLGRLGPLTLNCRMMAMRCGNRLGLFERMIELCRFSPIESLEALSVADRNVDPCGFRRGSTNGVFR